MSSGDQGQNSRMRVLITNDFRKEKLKKNTVVHNRIIEEKIWEIYASVSHYIDGTEDQRG